ncbi:MAG TPA: Ig-like domain repeat protein, partial [Chloroflexota bacterium]|nr:Ig-like domain repeat protein [Chloroflexota bacterium]
ASGSLTATDLGTAAAQIWFDANTQVSYSYSSPVSSSVSGKRYILDSSVSPNPSPASPINSLGAATPVTATYKAQYDTTTTVTSSANPSVYGQPVTFTATVATVASGGPTPTGSVQFSVDGSPYGSPVALSGGQAAVTISSLAVGGHTIAASYTPDTDSFTGSSGTLSQTVNKANTTTTVTSSANPSLLGQPVTFTATVSVVAPGAGTPTGSVSFYDGTTLLGTAALSGNQAQFTTSSLGVGSHNITASYSGDGNFNGSTSTTLVQQVNYGFLGLQSPYAPPPATFNVKRTMPLKWQYTDNNGNVVNSSTANPQVIIYGPYTCGQPDTAGTITVNDAGSSGYQYDPTTNTWQFNWQIKGNLTGCYDIYIKSQQSGQQNGPFPISVVNK